MPVDNNLNGGNLSTKGMVCSYSYLYINNKNHLLPIARTPACSNCFAGWLSQRSDVTLTKQQLSLTIKKAIKMIVVSYERHL